jgi:hypothetical protein
MVGLFFSKILVLLAAQTALAAQWEASAIKLGGERGLRQEGLQELGKIPDLDEKLRIALGRRNEVLAFEVIRALELRTFFPRLLGLVENAKGEKLDWRLILTVNSLAPIEDRQRLSAVYESKLRDQRVSPPAILALIAGLKKLDHRILIADLKKLLRHPSYEVRIAAVQATSHFLSKDSALGSVLASAVSASPFQVRFFAHRELARHSDLKIKFRAEIQNACARESSEIVKVICNKET